MHATLLFEHFMRIVCMFDDYNAISEVSSEKSNGLQLMFTWGHANEVDPSEDQLSVEVTNLRSCVFCRLPCKCALLTWYCRPPPKRWHLTVPQVV
jgi:hypothetical protein